MTVAAALAEPVSLFRSATAGQPITGLDRIGDRMKKQWRDMLHLLGSPDAVVSSSPAQQMTYDAFCKSRESSLCWQFRALPLKGPVLIVWPRKVLPILVDIFYGGTGKDTSVRDEWTSAEERFADRVGRDMAGQLAASWADCMPIHPHYAGAGLDLAEPGVPKPSEMVVVQTFTLSDDALGEHELSCVYLATALRDAPGLGVDGSSSNKAPADPQWVRQLSNNARNIHFPARSVLARPNLPFARLIDLKAGDVIPLLIPKLVPLTVAGRVFAYGRVGESNGRAAIMIDHINKGPTHE
jgi:flagellar motor switch protein FliM